MSAPDGNKLRQIAFDNIMEVQVNDHYFISTDNHRLDLQVLHNYLSRESYWAKGRTMETVQASVQASLNFGLYYRPDGSMVGAARVVTGGGATFAWLTDVFLLDAHRGNGLGIALVKATVQHPQLQNTKRFVLGTRDAHGLYKRFGFETLDSGDQWMVKRGSTK